MDDATLGAAMEFANRYARLKLLICRVNGGPVSSVPILHVRLEDRDAIAPCLGEEGAAQIPDLVHSIQTGEAKRLRYVAFLSDSFIQLRPSDSQGGAAETEDDLGAMLDAGDTDIIEALVCVCIDADTGDLELIDAPYSYDDTGQPVFAPAVRHERIEEGPTLAAIRKAVGQ